MGPYRDNALPQQRPKARNGMRALARLRRGWYKTVFPGIIILAMTVVAAIVISALTASVREKNENAAVENAYAKKGVESSRASLDEKVRAFEQRERDFNNRVRTFEDMLTTLPVLAKNNDPAVVAETLKRFNAANAPKKE